MEIIKKIKPSEKERDKIKNKVNNFLNKLDFKDAKPIIAGSIAKNTWLSGNYDIDIFIKFPYLKYKDKDISKILQKRIPKADIIHGSRDYFQIKKGKYKFELIPVLDINRPEEARNITDLSPFHTIWVKEHNKNPDQIRLSKALCKANNLYGAETYIKGFSGYLLEVLTIYYGTFFDFIINAARWKDKVIIDPMKYYKNEEELVKGINKAKHGPLIIVDPVQKERNVAAALSEDKFKEFIQLCKDFSHNPSDEFFKQKKFNLREIKESAEKNITVVLQVKPLKGKKDIIGTKVLKILYYINKELKENDFKLVKSNWFWDKDKKAYIYFIVKDEILPETIKHYGPPVKEEKHIEAFQKKWVHHKLHEDGNRVYVEIRRKHRKIKPFIEDIIKDDYIKRNARKIKVKVY